MSAKLWIGCAWPLDGQCSSSADQSNALGGSVLSWASVALPWKATVSPTFQVKPVVGVTIVAVGGVLPAVIATVSTAKAP